MYVKRPKITTTLSASSVA